VTRRHPIRPLCAALVVVFLGAGVGGCEHYTRPNRPVPEAFEVRTFDGESIRREDLLGRPWVINIWVPG
jgi:hypothetical protein